MAVTMLLPLEMSIPTEIAFIIVLLLIWIFAISVRPRCPSSKHGLLSRAFIHRRFNLLSDTNAPATLGKRRFNLCKSNAVNESLFSISERVDLRAKFSSDKANFRSNDLFLARKFDAVWRKFRHKAAVSEILNRL
jgi:hypothetical protein